MSDLSGVKDSQGGLYHYGNMFDEHLPKDKKCGYIRRLLPIDYERIYIEGATIGFFSTEGLLLAIGQDIDDLFSVICDWNCHIFSVH